MLRYMLEFLGPEAAAQDKIYVIFTFAHQLPASPSSGPLDSFSQLTALLLMGLSLRDQVSPPYMMRETDELEE